MIITFYGLAEGLEDGIIEIIRIIRIVRIMVGCLMTFGLGFSKGMMDIRGSMCCI